MATQLQYSTSCLRAKLHPLRFITFWRLSVWLTLVVFSLQSTSQEKEMNLICYLLSWESVRKGKNNADSAFLFCQVEIT